MSEHLNKTSLIVYVFLCFVGYSYFVSCISFCTTFVLVSWTLFVRFIFLPTDCDMVLRIFEKYGKNANNVIGKVTWVTGASTGIGEALAIALSKGGAKLILSARSEDKLEIVKRKCIEAGGLNPNDVLVLPFNMVDYDKHEWAFSSAVKHFGKIDVLISNAGRSQRGHWESIDVAVDKELFELNVFSLINLARIVTRHFISVGAGQHVVMSSIAGVLGAPMSASYTGSKHALHGYFECLRMEKGSKGISITLICPGPVKSNLDAGMLAEKVGEKVGKSRVGKLMSAERCAELSLVAMVNKLPGVDNGRFLPLQRLFGPVLPKSSSMVRSDC